MDTATGQTIKKIYYKAEGEDDESTKMTVFYCIDSSSAMGYLVAYLTCHVKENTFNRLVVFDLEENGLLTWHDSLMYEGTQISKVIFIFLHCSFHNMFIINCQFSPCVLNEFSLVSFSNISSIFTRYEICLLA